MIHLSDYPQLRLLAWSRPGAVTVTEEEALALYERHWRHVDPAAFTAAEADVVQRLARDFGHGILNVSNWPSPTLPREAVLDVLHRFDPEVLEHARCFLGGGSLLSLLLEYCRDAEGLDFLCSDREGYRFLRETVFEGGMESLFLAPPRFLRATAADSSGLRTILQLDPEAPPIRLSIHVERRIELSAEAHAECPVPVLNFVDRYATQLLALADRATDPAPSHGDLLDLAAMIRHWGAIPAEALDKVRSAYGPTFEEALETAVRNFSVRNDSTHDIQDGNLSSEAIDAIQAGWAIDD